MDRIEQTISSVEVAEMVGKAHNKLMRDIREYIDQLAQSNLGHDEFFTESTYVVITIELDHVTRSQRKDANLLLTSLQV